MKLSLSMIVKNEERFVGGCLESVADLADEIVIVDTGSNDRTKEIAQGFGAEVLEFDWCDDFSAARNFSLEHTTGDWVLYLDADERLATAYHQKLRRLISNGKADAFLLNLKSKIGTSEGAQYHLVSYPRLFRKMKGVKFVGKAHEQITTSLVASRARIVQTDIIIEHLGYAQDDEVIIKKARRNHHLLLSQLETRENYGYALYQLGQTEIILGDVDKGLARLYEALAAGGFGKSVEASIHSVIAENTFKKGNYEPALVECERSIAAMPEQSFAYIMRGDIFLALGRYRESMEDYRKALEKYRSTILLGKSATAVEPVFDVEILYSKLGRSASLAGMMQDAKSYLELATRSNRSERRVAAYLEFLARNKMYSEFLGASAEFLEFENLDWYLRLRSSVLIDTGDYQGAASILSRLPEHDKMSLFSLANCRLKLGDLAGADEAFQRAVSVGYCEPGGMEIFGLLQFKLGKYFDSAQTLSKVVGAEPGNVRAAKILYAARQLSEFKNQAIQQSGT